ncbi:histidine kinase dimerization/phospho-acceptor domain-containing protein [Archangium lansingense]|uniref:histidine kinase dimerization/phospho-acceptor domain-containing protein n=1 Tax=Archangium lansingense TaxID=2995310 RepID=UPI003B788BDF
MGSLTASSFSNEDKLLFRVMVQRISSLLFQAHLQEREQAQKRLLDAILTQLPVGVAVAEAPSGRLILGNEAFERIWRHPFIYSPDTTGYREYQGFHPDGRPIASYEWPIARSLEGEVVHGEELTLLRGDDTRGVTLQNSAPIRDAEGRIIAAVVTVLDVTDRKAAEEQLRRMAEFRERFLGIVSHDLRNPLNAIRLSADALLHSESVVGKRLKSVHRILSSAERMGRPRGAADGASGAVRQAGGEAVLLSPWRSSILTPCTIPQAWARSGCCASSPPRCWPPPAWAKSEKATRWTAESTRPEMRGRARRFRTRGPPPARTSPAIAPPRCVCAGSVTARTSPKAPGAEP